MLMMWRTTWINWKISQKNCYTQLWTCPIIMWVQCHSFYQINLLIWVPDCDWSHIPNELKLWMLWKLWLPLDIHLLITFPVFCGHYSQILGRHMRIVCHITYFWLTSLLFSFMSMSIIFENNSPNIYFGSCILRAP